MANNQPYQSTWNGAMMQTPTNQTPQMPVQPPQPANNQYQMPAQQFMNFPQMPIMQPQNPLIIVPVPSEAAVDNYIVERGITAFLINYSEGVFWTKRQKDDGLGYDTVKHVFFKEEDYSNKRQNDEKLNRSMVQQEDFDRLREDFYALKHEFQEFIK